MSDIKKKKRKWGWMYAYKKTFYCVRSKDYIHCYTGLIRRNRSRTGVVMHALRYKIIEERAQASSRKEAVAA